MRFELVFLFVFLYSAVGDQEQYTRFCVRPNEELRCVYDCPPERTCKTRDIKFSCALEGRQCNRKCVCKEGYIRNPARDCIPEQKCDVCKGPNEYFACGSACDTECANMHQFNKTYGCPIVNVVCNEKCYCEDGFARDSRNICIPENECKKSTPSRCKSELRPKRSSDEPTLEPRLAPCNTDDDREERPFCV